MPKEMSTKRILQYAKKLEEKAGWYQSVSNQMQDRAERLKQRAEDIGYYKLTEIGFKNVRYN